MEWISFQGGALRHGRAFMQGPPKAVLTPVNVFAPYDLRRNFSDPLKVIKLMLEEHLKLRFPFRA